MQPAGARGARGRNKVEAALPKLEMTVQIRTGPNMFKSIAVMLSGSKLTT